MRAERTLFSGWIPLRAGMTSAGVLLGSHFHPLSDDFLDRAALVVA